MVNPTCGHRRLILLTPIANVGNEAVLSFHFYQFGSSAEDVLHAPMVYKRLPRYGIGSLGQGWDRTSLTMGGLIGHARTELGRSGVPNGPRVRPDGRRQARS